MNKPKKIEIWDEAKLKLQFPGDILVNTEGGHYKFWSAELNNDGTYTAYWGRIGNKIQSMRIPGTDYSIQCKIEEKKRKGYREI